MRPVLPTDEQIQKRVQQILRRGSLNVGGNAPMDRLMLMFTRSCELRCSYCFVDLDEEDDGELFAGQYRGLLPRGELGRETLSQAIDLLMTSSKPRLGLQTFGGEPTRCFDRVLEMIELSLEHRRRQGRPVEFLVTTNGLSLSAERIAALQRPGVVVELSLDGDQRGNRFRRPLVLGVDEAWAATEAAVERLKGSGLRWFMNATLPPAAAGELGATWAWARARAVPALQINYGTGMAWTRAQVETWLLGLQAMLAEHRADPRGMELLNWANDADPVPLCGDIIVDVDGTVLQVGGLFHERRFPQLREPYLRGQVGELAGFEGLRFTLQGLWERTRQVLGPREWEIFAGNVALGAAVDLVVQVARRSGSARLQTPLTPGA